MITISRRSLLLLIVLLFGLTVQANQLGDAHAFTVCFVSISGPIEGQVRGTTPSRYSFEVEETALYRIYTTSDIDTVGELLNANYDSIERNDNDGAGLNFSITKILSTGTYHIRVRGSDENTNGNFTLHIRRTVIRSISNRPIRSHNVNGQINGLATVCFSFQVLDRFTRIYTRGNVDTFGQLFDENSNIIAENDDSGHENNFLIEQQLTAGNYYIAIRGFNERSSGSFRLYINALERACNEAETISLDRYISCRADGTKLFFYRFTVIQGGSYRIYTRGFVDTVGQLLNSTCNIIAEDDDSGRGTNFQIEHELEPGIYYVAVGGFSDRTSGGFELRVYMQPGVRTSR